MKCSNNMLVSNSVSNSKFKTASICRARALRGASGASGAPRRGHQSMRHQSGSRENAVRAAWEAKVQIEA